MRAVSLISLSKDPEAHRRGERWAAKRQPRWMRRLTSSAGPRTPLAVRRWGQATAVALVLLAALVVGFRVLPLLPLAVLAGEAVVAVLWQTTRASRDGD